MVKSLTTTIVTTKSTFVVLMIYGILSNHEMQGNEKKFGVHILPNFGYKGLGTKFGHENFGYTSKLIHW